MARGSNYPPGCTKGPYDDVVVDPSPLAEVILGLLEAAGIDTETNDAIMRLVDRGERRKHVRELAEKVDRAAADHIDGYDRDDLDGYGRDY